MEKLWDNFIINQPTIKKDLLHNDTCDKYDYLTAVACGVIGGLVDIFLVGMPQDSILGNWTDKQTDHAVKAFAKISGWKPLPTQSDNLANAIGFLEKKFKVNYDQRYAADVGGLFTMSPNNHHLMSLGHSPDIFGLFFSILNQFTSTSSFAVEGSLISVKTDTFSLQGNNLISKIFCGIANWFGHIMSDVAGSSGSRGKFGRGTGVSIPFYELFQFCKFGEFQIGREKKDLSTLAIRVFQEGYDLRFGLAMAIPVVVTELLIRLIWAIRNYFINKRPLKECIPSTKHQNLRVMLLLGNGVLCTLDGIDAAVRSGGNLLFFVMRCNLIAWYRLLFLIFKEICIRLGLIGAIQHDLLIYQRIHQAMRQYLTELEKIDISQFREETSKYIQLGQIIDKEITAEQLNQFLVEHFEYNAWQGDFNAFMSDKDNRLIFE